MPAFDAAASTLGLSEASVDEFESVTTASDGVMPDSTTGSGVGNATN